jgi:4-hydroxy-3-polyprenylbenzoate decarboxylase
MSDADPKQTRGTVAGPARKLVVGLTGASGAIYAVRLLDVLVDAGCEVYLSISPAGKAVLQEELGIEIDLEAFEPEKLWATDRLAIGRVRSEKSQSQKPAGVIHYCHFRNLLAPIASGSFLTAGMVVCPCSGSTLGAISHAMGENLIHRAAEVHLKERRKLILVPRETPLSLVQLDNMRRVTEAGAVVLPASPGFYHGVSGVGDLVNFVVARICDQLGLEHALMRRWGSERVDGRE